MKKSCYWGEKPPKKRRVVNKDKSAAEKVAGPSRVVESLDETEEESEHVPALERLGRAIVTGDYTQAALDATVTEYFA